MKVGRGLSIDDKGLSYKIESKYLDFRIPIKYYFHNSGSLRPYFVISPNIGSVNGGNIYLDSYKAKVTDANMKSTNMGVLLGMGLKRPFTVNSVPFVFGIEAGYNMGLSDTYSNKEKSSEAYALNLQSKNYKITKNRKNRGIELNISLGVNLSFLKKKPKRIIKIESPVKEIIVKDTIPDKDCYTINEIVGYIDKGYDVNNRTICMNNIMFDFNDSSIKKESKPFLDDIILLLNKFQSMKMNIYGHTDDIGSNKYNMKLSNKRAFAVYSYLIENGISKTRLTYKGFGKSVPISKNDSEEGRYRNRRVEFEILNAD